VKEGGATLNPKKKKLLTNSDCNRPVICSRVLVMSRDRDDACDSLHQWASVAVRQRAAKLSKKELTAIGKAGAAKRWAENPTRKAAG